MRQDANEHLEKLIVARDGVRNFAEMFERLMRTTTDPRGNALLFRMLSEANQMIAEMDHSISRERREPVKQIVKGTGAHKSARSCC